MKNESNPFLNYSYKLIIHKNPETVFQYLIAPKKIKSWYIIPNLNTKNFLNVEYLDKQKEIGTGTKFIQSTKLEKPKKDLKNSNEKYYSIQTMKGIILEYDPPNILSIESIEEENNNKTIQKTHYKLKKINRSTEIIITIKTYYKYNIKIQSSIKIYNFFINIISLPFYLIIYFFKNVFLLMTKSTIASNTNLIYDNLKKTAEKE